MVDGSRNRRPIERSHILTSPNEGLPRSGASDADLSDVELTMLEDVVAPTRVAFKSAGWLLAPTLLLLVVAIGSGVGLRRLTQLEAEDVLGILVHASVLAAAMLTAAAVLSKVLAEATTWTTEDRSWDQLRRCGWFAIALLGRLAPGAVLIVLGVTFVVAGAEQPMTPTGDRDFSIIVQVGVTLAAAGVAFIVGGPTIYLARKHSLRAEVESMLNRLEDGLTPSTDALANLFSRLTHGFGVVTSPCFPIVAPARCSTALVHHHRTGRIDAVHRVVAEAYVRLGGVRRPLRIPWLRSMLSQVEREATSANPPARPGPVQTAVFSELIGCRVEPLPDLARRLGPSWRDLCAATSPAEITRCISTLTELCTPLTKKPERRDRQIGLSTVGASRR